MEHESAQDENHAEDDRNAGSGARALQDRSGCMGSGSDHCWGDYSGSFFCSHARDASLPCEVSQKVPDSAKSKHCKTHQNRTCGDDLQEGEIVDFVCI